MNPEDVPTIEEILSDYDVQHYLYDNQFQELLDSLRNRENVMLTEFGQKED